MMFNLRNIYAKRESWVRKGDFGRLLIVAGSEHYTGSPVFNAVSALRAGSDLVYIVAPSRAADIASSFLPDIITEPCKGPFLTRKQVPFILRMAEERKATAMLIGGGLGRESETFSAIREIVQKTDLPMVLDAEALRALAGRWRILKNKIAGLTPHAEEFRQLTGDAVGSGLSGRPQKVRAWAKKIGCVILLKGAVDVISDGKRSCQNRGGSAFMTKGGFGDTLAGICGALMARGIKPYEALCAASHINKKAGEMACRKFGEGTLASDIFEFIPKIIKPHKK